ncbi:MAG TPA: tetratricopeptide repeat protein, partial [Caldilineae bacterium]|nr:tetratricopeptide repeat protein [Caldilineae bacterium]
MVFDPHSDPLYQQAMQALQEGQWQEAIQSLEELLARYPENEAIKQFLDEAILKQKLESSSGRSVHPRRWPAWVRRYLLGVAIILFLAGAIALGILFINQRILPAMAEVQKEYQVKAMLEEGWIYLARGELDQADEVFHRAGALDPGAPKVLDALSAIQRQRQAERLYQEGVRLQEEGKYQEALEYFMEYITQTPYHRDAPQRILEA